MSTSILYHGFSIIGYQYQKTEFKSGEIHFHIYQEKRLFCCPQCDKKYVPGRGSKMRYFRTVPVGNKPIWICMNVPRVYCPNCEITRQVKLSFASERRTYTHSFERFALDLLKMMTILDVARHLGVSWDTIKDIEKRYLHKHFSNPNIRHLTHIAIDEISIGKGHKYLTIVLDLHTGAVVFVGDGKGSEALIPFFKRLKRCKVGIKAVATDLSPAYIKAVTENLPQATQVFDRFHIVRLMNDTIDQIRRKLQFEATEQQKDFIKGTRWLLLKNPQSLNSERREKYRLEKALEMNAPLATAYYLKEDLSQFWKQNDKSSAEIFLDNWIKRANSSKIQPLVRFATTLSYHKEGILAYYDHKITTGPLEGTNNKIKTLMKAAYGFRDLEFFKLKIKGLYRTKYALVG